MPRRDKCLVCDSPVKDASSIFCSTTCFASHRAIPKKPTLERIFEKIIRCDNGCWEWQGARLPHGYGQITVGSRFDGSRRTCRVHRVVYELLNGPIPPDMLVCHTCDNPPCCNPDHLFSGTHATNGQDMSAKGRGKKQDSAGERNGMAKLTSQDVLEIRRRFAEGGVTKMQLGREFGMSNVMISLIVRNKNWKEI